MKDSPYKEDEEIADPLDSRWFYEICQQYRHANIWDPVAVGRAFGELQKWIRQNATAKEQP